jgi:phospholipid/cholesterol/gamma-HCH transport system substrate-binding protein
VTGVDNAPRRGKIDPIWWAPVLLLVIAALSTLTVLLFNGTLRKSVPLTLVSDRAGLVMENGAKVKLRGVQVGEVASIAAESTAGADSSTLSLKMDAGPFQYLPSNIEAEIKSSTAFGAKYVDLIVPSGGASSESLKPGAVLHSRNVTVEVNTVFENLQAVVHSVDPAKLNAVLSAVAESVRGKGERIGQAITDANNVLLAVNPRMPTVQQDWQWFGKTAEAYSDAAQDILSILDSFSTTSTTITTHAKAAGRAAALRGGVLPVGDQHHRVKPAELGAGRQHPRSDDRPVNEVLADLHLPVPGRAVVPGARRPRCIGRQR